MGEDVISWRKRATQARRLSKAMADPKEREVLARMANELDAEATKLENPDGYSDIAGDD